MLLVVVFLSVLNPAVDALNPKFTQSGLDPVVDLYEYTNTITKVADLECEDTDTIQADVIVSLDSITPGNAACSSCFQVYPGCGTGTGSTNFCVQFLPRGTFDYDKVREYRLRFSCRDVTGEEADEDYTIYIRIVPNTPPVFNNPGAVSTTLTNTENVKAGGSVYQASCTDPNSDTLQYTLTTDPITSNLFEIDANGVIRAERDLNTYCRGSITFSVTCQDPYNSPVGPVSIQTTLNGANQQPAITGINYNRDVPENTEVGATLATFTINDDDSAFSCQIFSNPQESLQYFNLKVANQNSGQTSTSLQRDIVVKTTLNYEQTATRNTNLTVTCSDGFCTSSAAYLYVRVTDVNEPIDINPKNFMLSVNEGLISVDPQWTPIDEDVDDVPTYTIVGLNTAGLFAIHPTTGVITSTLEYDVDGGAMNSLDRIVVQATDKGGLTSTTTVTLTILDINDNRPTFANTASQTFTVDGCTAAGTSLGSVAATDADSDYRGNNVLTYSGGNGILTVSPNGDIVIGSAVTAGTHTVDVVATDAGEVPGPLASTTPARVSVTVTACTTTAAPTTQTVTAATTVAATAATGTGTASGSASSSSSSSSSSSISTSEPNTGDSLEENLGWIVVAALLGTAFLAALGYMIWKYCYLGGFCEGICGENVVYEETYYTRSPPPQQRPERKVTEVREVYRGNQPEAGNRGFWQERYPDDDYNGREPMRTRIPTPANYEAGNAPVNTYQQNNSWRTGRALAY